MGVVLCEVTVLSNSPTPEHQLFTPTFIFPSFISSRDLSIVKMIQLLCIKLSFLSIWFITFSYIQGVSRVMCHTHSHTYF